MSTANTPTTQQEKIQKWMNDKHPKFCCSSCQQNERFSAGMMAYSTYLNGSTITESPSPAMIQIICEDCYHVSLFAFNDQF